MILAYKVPLAPKALPALKAIPGQRVLRVWPVLLGPKVLPARRVLLAKLVP
ncbi:hypothetical protein GCM10027044_13600 [Hymenobacter ruber]